MRWDQGPWAQIPTSSPPWVSDFSGDALGCWKEECNVNMMEQKVNLFNLRWLRNSTEFAVISVFLSLLAKTYWHLFGESGSGGSFGTFWFFHKENLSKFQRCWCVFFKSDVGTVDLCEVSCPLCHQVSEARPVSIAAELCKSSISFNQPP